MEFNFANPSASFFGGLQTGRNMLAAQQQGKMADVAFGNYMAGNSFNDKLRAAMQQGASYDQAVNALAGEFPLKVREIQMGAQSAAAEAARAAEAHKLKMEKGGLENDKIRGEIAAAAQQMSAEERKVEADKIRRGAQAGLTAASPEQFDELMELFGLTQFVGQYENREGIAAQFLEIADAFERFDEQDAPPVPLSTPGKVQADINAGILPPDFQGAPADEYGRYLQEEIAAGRTPLSRIDYAQAKKGTETIYAPDGSVILQRGGANTKPPSERQSTIMLFSGLMNETMPAINAMEEKFNPASLKAFVAGQGLIGNLLTSEDAQKYEALKRQWAEGVLRIQTGAAATQPEIERVMETYFPRPGDTEQTIAQKRVQRDAFARSLGDASGGTLEAPGGASDRPGLSETSTRNTVSEYGLDQKSEAELLKIIETGSLQ